MAIIDNIMDDYDGYLQTAIATAHRRLKQTPNSARKGDHNDRVNALIILMWQLVALPVAPEWSCDCCKNASKPCLRMTIDGLVEFVVRDKEVVFLREYAYNCLRCIRNKGRCVITRMLIDDAHPEPGLKCEFDRTGASSSLMAMPRQGLFPGEKASERNHEQHKLPLLGYSEDQVKRYLKALRKIIVKEETTRLVTPKDLRNLDSRGSIDAFVDTSGSVLQTLHTEYADMAASMKQVLDSVKHLAIRKSTAATICRDFSKSLFKSVCKTLEVCPDAHLHSVDARGDRLVCYRVDKRHVASLHYRVLEMLGEEGALTSESDGSTTDDDENMDED